MAKDFIQTSKWFVVVCTRTVILLLIGFHGFTRLICGKITCQSVTNEGSKYKSVEYLAQQDSNLRLQLKSKNQYPIIFISIRIVKEMGNTNDTFICNTFFKNILRKEGFYQ